MEAIPNKNGHLQTFFCNNSTAILHLCLLQEEHLPVNGEILCSLSHEMLQKKCISNTTAKAMILVRYVANYLNVGLH